MSKAEIKTKKTRKKVSSFIDGIENPKRKEDARYILKLMKDITGKKPAMWGPSIVGFEDHTYTYP